MVSVAVADATASEPGVDNGQFKVTTAPVLGGDLTVKYSISGSAINGMDYALLSGTAIIPSGSTSTTVEVKPLDDRFVEGKESVGVNLATGIGYQIGSPSSASVSIVDND